MKPISLCLVQLGQKGLELVEAYPAVVPNETLNEIVIKSMPLGAKDGDFTSNNAGGCNFSGYVFAVPGEERKNIASLVAVYETMNYDRERLQKVFSFTIRELKKHQLANVEMVSKILPNLFSGLASGKFKIKISSVVTLEFSYDQEKKDKDRGEEFVESMKGDIWKP